jgi:beta-phosphoglucomutase
MPMSPRAVIFDVDGVLVDSYRGHLESWVQVAREHGLEITEEQFAKTFGRTSREIIAEFWGGDLSAERMRAVDDRKEALYRDLIRADFPAMEGASDLVRALHAAGFLLAVGSSGPPENIALSLDGLGCRDAFRVVVTGREVTRGKPDPEVFLIAAERLGIDPAACVVIEDAPAGVAAARAAGMRCVALLGTTTADRLAAADLVVASLRELDASRIDALLGPGEPKRG